MTAAGTDDELSAHRLRLDAAGLARGPRGIRTLLLGLSLAAFLPGAARAGDVGSGPTTPMVDVGVEQRATRTPDGSWQWGVGGAAVLPVLDLSSQFGLSLRLSDSGSIGHLSTHWSVWLNDFGRADGLSLDGRLDRGAGDRVAITLSGELKLEGLAGRLGLARTPWLQLGLQASTAGADAVGRTRWSSTLVLALDFDLASADAERRGRTSSGFRIRASAALGNDPGCGLGTPALLFSGRCLTLALAVEY